MLKRIEKHINKLKQLCELHKVKNLFVFGSILTDDFKEGSDIDFIVEFGKVEIKDYADNYFSLKESLQKLFEREIDLLEFKAIKNHYFLEEIENKKELIYHAA